MHSRPAGMGQGRIRPWQLWGGVCSLFYSREEQNGIQSRTYPAFIFPAGKFSVVYPIKMVISGIRI